MTTRKYYVNSSATTISINTANVGYTVWPIEELIEFCFYRNLSVSPMTRGAVCMIPESGFVRIWTKPYTDTQIRNYCVIPVEPRPKPDIWAIPKATRSYNLRPPKKILPRKVR